MTRVSSIPGFHKLPIKKRIKYVKQFAGLSRKEARMLKHNSALSLKLADMMSENVIGTTQLPLSVATYFRINGRDYLVPMALEEPSVIAAASHAAKLTRPEGFTASSTEPMMIGQIQFVHVKDIAAAKRKILKAKAKILDIANAQDSLIVKLGGGARDVEVRVLGKMLIVHLIVDVKDAMGANLVNTMAEAVTPYVKELVGGEPRLRIISNLAVKRLVRARAVWKKRVLGDDTIKGIIDAYAFAKLDPYRCATHNKGIMNGIDAVAIATGNDFRALEAGAHAYAALNGGYKPLTKYYRKKNGDLVGEIELPIAAGTVGGVTRSHPIAQISLKILDVKSAQELAQVMACVGLANNFAALRAMVVEGIQHGHMKLHARHIAMAAGAHGRLIKKLSHAMVNEKKITSARARELLEKFKSMRKKK
mgnify:CR=1 FL=1